MSSWRWSRFVGAAFISDEEAGCLFAEQGGFRNVRSYLRFVRDPSLRCLWKSRDRSLGDRSAEIDSVEKWPDRCR